jgi:hypothetical protein
MKTWTSEETAILVENYNKVSNTELLALIPAKSARGIYKKAYKMGLRKTPEITFKNRSEARRGEKSASWNGGKRMTRNGYRQLLMPGHPRADSTGYVMEHIIVWEKASGMQLPHNCCIHHLNGNKSDNRIENLCVMLHSAHTVFHHTGAKRSAETRNKISKARLKRNAQ